jgi:hypothetical protein
MLISSKIKANISVCTYFLAGTENDVSRQVINEISHGGDLAIDEFIASSPDITCMIYMFC